MSVCQQDDCNLAGHATKTYLIALHGGHHSALGKACLQEILFIQLFSNYYYYYYWCFGIALGFELEFSASSFESLYVTILCSSLYSCPCFTVLVCVCFLKIDLMINFTYINVYIYIHTERYESACMQLLMQFPNVLNW